MSQRVKRPHRPDDAPVATKRRKGRPTAPEEEETSTLANSGGGAWQPRPITDLKISSIYNRSAPEAPAELFRKDLISAMKLPDSEPLAQDEYWVIGDQWKQEWERGVQVPVNPDSLPEPAVSTLQPSHYSGRQDFKLPKNKYIRITKDEHFTSELHYLSNTPAMAEAACSYDLDGCDASWLRVLNGERALAGLGPVSEEQLERVLEELETRCWDRIQSIMKSEEGLGIEYDENVICDVCRSPDSEEANEMVFCDSCNICVHQACYGITTIPSGQWLCRTCALGQRPECVLCPNKGGAMKCTKSGQKWAHVSCALWIPEVSIGCVERMEPITKISSIPASRWALICVLCRERVGSCIQCSVKTCKTAYHVTCAFKHGLEMRAIIEDENADDGVKLRSYCQKHSVTSKKEKTTATGGNGGGSCSEDDDSKRKKRKDMTSEERNQARAARLQEIESEFDKHVSVKDISCHLLEVDQEAIHYIYNYWKLKRRAGLNRPLLPPKSDDIDMLSHKQEQADLEKMKSFVQLRQDLERVRNLCYMVSRREKLSRSFFKMREQTFHKQVAVLEAGRDSLESNIVAAVVQANHGPSIYDRLYSHTDAEDHTMDFETVLARIAGYKSPVPQTGKKGNLNGINIDKNKRLTDNPYQRLYFNGTARRSTSLYGSSISSDSDRARQRANSTTEDDEKTSPSIKQKTLTPRVRKNSESTNKPVDRRKFKSSVSANSRTKGLLGSSSEDDGTRPDWRSPRSRTLRHLERELGDRIYSGTDSDEFISIRDSKPSDHKISAAIYSDSDSTDNRADNTTTDSQLLTLRTKAALKEFTQVKSKPKGRPPKEKIHDSAEEEFKEIEIKTKKDPTDLIVPQRQAAKKAFENMRSTTTTVAGSVKAKEEPKVEPKVEPKQELEASPTEEQRPRSKVKSRAKDRKPSTATSDIFSFEGDVEKDDTLEILAYVPQRQAAKKAAEHIKSGKKPETIEDPTKVKVSPVKEDEEKEVEKEKDDDKEKEKPKQKEIKEKVKEKEIKTKEIKVKVKEKEPKDKEKDIKENDKQEPIVKSPGRSSSSSSSDSSSSGSSTSSSSDTEDDNRPSKAPDRKDSSAKELPFLDKGAKSSASVSSSVSTSSSSSSDSSSSEPDTKPAPKNKASVKPKPTEKHKLAEKSKPSNKPAEKSQSIDKPKLADKPLPEEKYELADKPKLADKSKIADKSKLAYKPKPKDKPKPAEKSKQSEKNKLPEKPKPTEKPKFAEKPKVSEKPKLPDKPKFSEKAKVPEKTKQPEKSKLSEKNKLATDKPPEKPKLADKSEESQALSKPDGRKLRRVSDKKLKTAEWCNELEPQVVERAESARRNTRNLAPFKEQRGRGRGTKPSNSSDRLRDASVRPGNMVGRLCDKDTDNSTPVTDNARKRKPSDSEFERPQRESSSRKSRSTGNRDNTDVAAAGKESIKPCELPSTERKTDKKLIEEAPSQKPEPDNLSKLEREIMERKAEREPSSNKTSGGSLDRLFTKREKAGKSSPLKSIDKVSPVKENREPTSRISERRKELALVGSQKSTFAKDLPSRDNISDADTTIKCDPIVSLISDDEIESSDKTYREPKSMIRSKKQAAGILSDAHGNLSKLVEIKTDEKDESIQNTKINDEKKDLVIALEIDQVSKELSTPVLLPEVKEKPLQEHGMPSDITKNSLKTTFPNRSIFSPQPSSKENELFDFEDDILAVDDTVNDDGFGISRDPDEMLKALPLTFSFSSEFLFKEDCKEDSARETLHLVEKLRMELSKKSGTNQHEEMESVSAPKLESVKIKGLTPPPEQPVTITENTQEVDIPSAVLVNDCNAIKNVPPPLEVPAALDIPSFMEHCRATAYAYEPELDVHSTPTLDRERLDHSVSAPADERWVPPSHLDTPVDKQPFNIDNLSPSHIMQHPQLAAVQQEFMEKMHETYLEQQQQEQQQQEQQQQEQQQQQQEQQQQQQQQQQHHHQQHQQHIMNQPEETPRRDFDNSVPSPYTQQVKWAESEIMPVRRSSSSSPASSTSEMNEEPLINRDIVTNMGNTPSQPVMMPELAYSNMHSYPGALEALQYNPYSEASQFVGGPVSLFPPTSLNTQLPFPSPGAAMFPPAFGAPFPNPHSLMQPVLKPSESMHYSSTCGAAFTSSSHNMALTAAMVSPTPSVVHISPPEASQPLDIIPAEALPEIPTHVDLEPPTDVPIPEIPAVNKAIVNCSNSSAASPAGKRSPAKPTRTSARVVSQQSKSPGKSPGKSPRQQDPSIKTSQGRGRGEGGNKRGSSKGSSNKAGYGSTRGRGRGRGRGRAAHHIQHFQHGDLDFLSGTMHNKLVGTVYDLDFDDDIAEVSMENLRAMRERRRSADIHERRSDSSYRSHDSSQSPKFASPPHQLPTSKRPSYSTDIRDLRPPSPISDMHIVADVPRVSPASVPTSQPFPDMVQPVLPGPVDMRTYSAFEPIPNTEAYNNHLLGAFATGTADHALPDIDEEMEKELHSALIASSIKPIVPLLPPAVVHIPRNENLILMPESESGKVSLLDSRNQLKVKIKGPFLDANYAAASSCAPIAAQVIPILEPNKDVPIPAMSNCTMNAYGGSSSSGTSSLRRMRKKELLRQYWTQDMNMDDPNAAAALGQSIISIPTPMNRSTITIPKAVASMTTIPTREDYKAVVDANMEKKRKKIPGMSRELRHLDISYDDYDEPERRRSVGSIGSNTSTGIGPSDAPLLSYKRRARITKPPVATVAPQPVAPKLKIKIGGSFMGGMMPDIIDTDAEIRFHKPPKKRHSSIPMPSMEDLKRESMKFRKMVMADFDEDKKVKKKGKKKKKRKEEKRAKEGELQIISNDNTCTTKLIIRLGKKKDDECRLAVPPPPDDPFDYDPMAPDPLALDSPLAAASSDSGSSSLRKVRTSKLTPIRLKLARNSQGSGYVMSNSESGPVSDDHADPLGCPALPLNKDCEVR